MDNYGYRVYGYANKVIGGREMRVREERENDSEG